MLVLLSVVASCVIEPCHTSLDCGDTDVCWDGTCQPTVDRWWAVDVLGAEVDWLHPDGHVWDDDMSPPDLYVEFGLEEGDGCLTDYVADEFAPTWYQGCDFYVPGDGLFLVNLWDFDGVSDDFAAGWYWDGAWEISGLGRMAGEPVELVDETGTILVWMDLQPI